MQRRLKMFAKFQFLSTVSVAILSLSMIGCGGPQPSGTRPAQSAHVDHHDEGPHGGTLIEFGNEEYHAELVHDEAARTVTVYVLGGDAKTSVAIAVPELTINLTHDGQAEQFKLAASADAKDAPGKSSRFVSSDAELVADLDHEGVKAELAVTIDGKPYRAKIDHHHDK
jgi:hypothetical protein